MKPIVWLAAFAAVLVAPGHKAAAQSETLRVCLGTADDPRANRATDKGIDIAVMTAVAAKMDVGFSPVWIETVPLMTEVEESDLPLENLLAGDCDAVASVAGETAIRGSEGAVLLSVPYYGAGFELVGPQGTATDLDDLGDSTIVVQTVSVGHLVVNGLGIDWRSRPSPAGQLAVLDDGAADAALVWGPALGPLGREPVAGWTPPPVLRWNMHVALRKADQSLKKRVDDALRELVASGEVAAILDRSGVPVHLPFEETFTPEALSNLARNP